MPAEDRRCANLTGINRIGSKEVSNQTAAKRRNDIWAGEDWRQWDVHQEETVGVSIGVLCVVGEWRSEP